VERSAEGIELRDGETLVAEARPAEPELELPEPVGVEQARKVSREGFQRWSTSHPFRTCVVCGPDRDSGDGFGVFPGALEGRDGRFAAVWEPDASLADGEAVCAKAVWAALDCPTSAPVVNFGQGPPCVLARLTARVDGSVEPQAPHVVVSWPLGRDGRKRHSAAALFSPDGRPVAWARALWIELKA
jgi:hypothetical protein